MNYKPVMLLLFFWLVYSCKSPMEVYQNYQGAKISIGSGGGFSGEYNEYILFDNGNIYHSNSLKKQTVFKGSVSKNEAKQIFQNYFTLHLNESELNSPGNFNYFIKYENGDNKHKLIWSNSSEMDPNIKLFYKILKSKISGLSGK